jgi:hypothetical protein
VAGADRVDDVLGWILGRNSYRELSSHNVQCNSILMIRSTSLKFVASHDFVCPQESQRTIYCRKADGSSWEGGISYIKKEVERE